MDEYTPNPANTFDIRLAPNFEAIVGMVLEAGGAPDVRASNERLIAFGLWMCF